MTKLKEQYGSGTIVIQKCNRPQFAQKVQPKKIKLKRNVKKMPKRKVLQNKIQNKSKFVF